MPSEWFLGTNKNQFESLLRTHVQIDRVCLLLPTQACSCVTAYGDNDKCKCLNERPVVRPLRRGSSVLSNVDASSSLSPSYGVHWIDVFAWAQPIDNDNG